MSIEQYRSTIANILKTNSSNLAKIGLLRSLKAELEQNVKKQQQAAALEQLNSDILGEVTKTTLNESTADQDISIKDSIRSQCKRGFVLEHYQIKQRKMLMSCLCRLFAKRKKLNERQYEMNLVWHACKRKQQNDAFLYRQIKPDGRFLDKKKINQGLKILLQEFSILKEKISIVFSVDQEITKILKVKYLMTKRELKKYGKNNKRDTRNGVNIPIERENDENKNQILVNI